MDPGRVRLAALLRAGVARRRAGTKRGDHSRHPRRPGGGRARHRPRQCRRRPYRRRARFQPARWRRLGPRRVRHRQGPAGAGAVGPLFAGEVIMAHKVVLLADPGIDTAFALALALLDPELEVIGIAATAGNVDAKQATQNVQTIVEHVDPPRWPRLGSALPMEYEVDGTRLHGAGGLGGVSFPCAELHRPHTSDKLLIDLIRQCPKEITVITMGPLSVLAYAFDRDRELPLLIKRLICLGGAWHEPGN